MAKARMLHCEISKSLEVDSLPVPARLLFTWMIPHADDEGRLKGHPKYIKGTVVPLTNWSVKNIQEYLELMKKVGLIYYWQENNEWFIEFIKWGKHQQIRKDRFVQSNLPSFNKSNDNLLSTKSQPDDNQMTPQDNIKQYNLIEVNKKESNITTENDAEKKTYKGGIRNIPNPATWTPETEGEVAAKEAWEKLEANHSWALKATYLRQLDKGLPPQQFYQFVSEIKQDNTIRFPGAVFIAKANEWFGNHPDRLIDTPNQKEENRDRTNENED